MTRYLSMLERAAENHDFINFWAARNAWGTCASHRYDPTAKARYLDQAKRIDVRVGAGEEISFVIMSEAEDRALAYSFLRSVLSPEEAACVAWKGLQHA